MAVKLFLQILKAESIFGKYSLCITMSDVVIDNDDVDADDMTIECYDFVEPSELAVVVVGNIESLPIINVGGEELISDCYNSVVKVNQKYKNKATLVSIMRSSSAILSRKFIEFCILVTDNLSRTLLMHLSNSPSVASVYFPTILCNSRKFNKTTINRNIWYASINSRQEARQLNSSDFNEPVMNGAAFATPFKANDLILD
ncbi:beta-glucuronosyltransferase GlcAT14C-like [Capsicum annuum]|uniref:beta-glucuronosyltransferase GlcAT14C-like n=1 Tax=Capsicum annuum TaxID=4072 RepID=UPI0007BF8BE2|nr:beta-glucuronosyltransferase GlcAT14C-like [Capsicum annuum]